MAPWGRAPDQSRCPELPDPARPRLQPAPPAHPPAHGADQALRRPPRRAQREPDSGQGLPPTPLAPPAPRQPPAAPRRRTSPAESASLTSPARGAPSAAAGARPVPAAPAAAPARAPRPRKRFSAPPPQRRRFRAGTDRGAGDAGRAPLRDSESGIPLGLCPGVSPRTNGLAAALVPTPGGSGGSSAHHGLPPAFSSAPPAGGRRAAPRGAPGAPGAEWVRGQDPRPAITRGLHPPCAQPSASETLALTALRMPAPHPGCTAVTCAVVTLPDRVT